MFHALLTAAIDKAVSSDASFYVLKRQITGDGLVVNIEVQRVKYLTVNTFVDKLLCQFLQAFNAVYLQRQNHLSLLYQHQNCSRIQLENYFLPGDLENQIEAFVDYYNHQRDHESLKKPHAS